MRLSCIQRKIKLNCLSLVLALNLVAVCEAAELYYIEQSDTNTNWDTAGNWFKRDTNNAYESNGKEPSYEDNVVLSGGLLAPNGLIVNTSSAVARGGQFRMGVWANVGLTINAGAKLQVGGLVTENQSTIVNNGTFESTHVAYLNGTFNLTNNSGASFTSQGFNVAGKATITNYGSMNIAAGRLFLATASGDNTWNMEGGTITAKRIVMVKDGIATLNLNGGDIFAEEISFRVDSNYKIRVGDGRLEVVGNATWILDRMKEEGNLYAANSEREVSVYQRDSKTIVELAAVPEPAHVAIVMGLFALIYLPLSARRVAL